LHEACGVKREAAPSAPCYHFNNFISMKLIIFLLLPISLLAQNFTKEEITRWQQQAKQVTIIRDKWGIPHIYGKTDAD
jgi:acyl-homoserine lactone acylase PvdQ